MKVPSSFTDMQLESMASDYVQGNIAIRLFPRYVGAILDQILLGVLLTQFISYTRFLRTDRLHTIALATLSFLGAVAASICTMMWFIDVFVWKYGSFLAITEIKFWIIYGSIDISTIFIVQMYYVERCYRLFKSWWPTALIAFLPICAVGFGAGLLPYTDSHYSYMLAEAVDDNLRVGLLYAWIGMTFVSDLAITISIVVGLRRVRSGWRDVDSAISRVIARSCEIQLPGLIIALLTLGLYVQPSEVSSLFLLIHTKVYVGGLFMNLNFRQVPSGPMRPYGPSHNIAHSANLPLPSTQDGSLESHELDDIGTIKLRPASKTARANNRDVEHGEVDGDVDDFQVEWGQAVEDSPEYGSTVRLAP